MVSLRLIYPRDGSLQIDLAKYPVLEIRVCDEPVTLIP